MGVWKLISASCGLAALAADHASKPELSRGQGAVIAPKTISTIHPPMKIETFHTKSQEGGIMND